MITREEVLNQIYATTDEWDKDKRKPSLEVVRKSIFQIYDSFDEELEAREKNTARIRKRKDELYEELGRYRQEYTKAKQKIDSIGTCGECKHYKETRGHMNCIELNWLPVVPDHFCKLFERKDKS